MEIKTCDIESVDADKVARVKESMDADAVGKVAAIFRALGEVNRTRIVKALSLEESLCVCAIATIIDATIATTSHHLRSLHRQGIIKSKKEGKMVYYSLDDDHIRQIVSMAFLHQEELTDHDE